MRTIFTALALLVFAGAANAQVQTPLPDKILQARTVFVENQSKYVNVADNFYEAISKWKRLRIAANKSDADLVVVLSTDEHEALASNYGVYATRHIMTGGGGTYSYTDGSTQMSLIDPASGVIIWTNTMPWSKKGATRQLVNDLKKRIERQEKRKR